MLLSIVAASPRFPFSTVAPEGATRPDVDRALRPWCQRIIEQFERPSARRQALGSPPRALPKLADDDQATETGLRPETPPISSTGVSICGAVLLGRIDSGFANG